MGSGKELNKKSPFLKEEDISMYMQQFSLSREDIHQIYGEFLAYDTDGNGVITIDDLCRLVNS